MKRKISAGLLIKFIIYLKYLPSVILQIRNWPVFLLNYINIGFVKPGTYKFRNGISIKTVDAHGAGAIAVIFMKKDYGVVDDNSTIIDIGANIGVYSLFAASAKNTVVYAFEPDPSNFELLVKNVRLNKLEKRIIPFNLAVGSEKGKRTLYLGEAPFHSFCPVSESPFNALYPSHSGGAKQNSIEVACVSLKDIFDKNKISHCDILKIDCEGAEYEILYNLPEKYFQRIKKIHLEYHNHKKNAMNTGDCLLKFLEKKGLQLKRHKKGSAYQGDLWLERQPL